MILGLLGVLSPVLDKVLSFIPNPADREKARLAYELEVQSKQLEIMKLFAASDAGQVEINKIEAASDDKFKSYWRPALAWTCVAAYAWMYLLQPITIFVLLMLGKEVPMMPTFDLGEMTPVLMGVLGLAGLRTYEKRNK